MIYTEIIQASAAATDRAARLIASGELVAFPTETVYGLGANALNETAVQKIFDVKGRPADNPLIVHIADRKALEPLVAATDSRAERLMDVFWPGPLTLVFRRAEGVPSIVSAGLRTIAVRLPANPDAQALIRRAGLPIAAPSANPSGRPSPTTARHVYDDLNGRIRLIIDGGPCLYGVESTVVDVTSGTPVILRPGGVTVEMLRAILPDIVVDPSVLEPLREEASALSPGMKHRHYAPNARIIVVAGAPDRVAETVRMLYKQAIAPAAILCAAGRVPCYAGLDTVDLGAGTADMAAVVEEAAAAAEVTKF
ncbi:MAG: L-threonylcarbamoyladenylate synthase [Clostridia bacterium]|nr:L-threonylcarbamoyladenylate synthase [Clostridia bacterium]